MQRLILGDEMNKFEERANGAESTPSLIKGQKLNRYVARCKLRIQILGFLFVEGQLDSFGEKEICGRDVGSFPVLLANSDEDVTIVVLNEFTDEVWPVSITRCNV